jgi:hypothetical protein
MWELAELATDAQGTVLPANSYGVSGSSVKPWVPAPSARAAAAPATWDFDMIYVRNVYLKCLCASIRCAFKLAVEQRHTALLVCSAPSLISL